MKTKLTKQQRRLVAEAEAYIRPYAESMRFSRAIEYTTKKGKARVKVIDIADKFHYDPVPPAPYCADCNIADTSFIGDEYAPGSKERLSCLAEHYADQTAAEEAFGGEYVPQSAFVLSDAEFANMLALRAMMDTAEEDNREMITSLT